MRSAKKIQIILVVIASVCIFSYRYIDIPLARYFEHLSSPLRAIATLATNSIDPQYQCFLWPILFFIFRFIWKQKLWASYCLLILISVSLSNALVEMIKCLLGRARPEMLFSEGIFGFTFFTVTNAFKSFPSGHACTVGAICGALACCYPKKTLPLLLLALLFAMTRVILNQHFLSDIIAGLTIGILISQRVFIIMRIPNNTSFLRRKF